VLLIFTQDIPWHLLLRKLKLFLHLTKFLQVHPDIVSSEVILNGLWLRLTRKSIEPYKVISSDLIILIIIVSFKEEHHTIISNRRFVTCTSTDKVCACFPGHHSFFVSVEVEYLIEEFKELRIESSIIHNESGMGYVVVNVDFVSIEKVSTFNS